MDFLFVAGGFDSSLRRFFFIGTTFGLPDFIDEVSLIFFFVFFSFCRGPNDLRGDRRVCYGFRFLSRNTEKGSVNLSPLNQ